MVTLRELIGRPKDLRLRSAKARTASVFNYYRLLSRKTAPIPNEESVQRNDLLSLIS
jgi:hypothetical protein